MRASIVFTLTGTDRVGIVEEVTKAVLELGGNVETSRMARLRGEFSALMLISLPAERRDALDSALDYLTGQGYEISTTVAHDTVDPHAGWRAYHVEVEGADHEGIIHEIASGLSQAGISIETMDTETVQASVSGTSLFTMKALVVVPPTLSEAEWVRALDEAAREANVDVTVSPAEG
jgi:glycine cleavage system transcriptional repressor